MSKKLMPLLALTLLAGAAAGAVALAATPQQIGQAHRRAAIKSADQVLAQAVLLAGSEQVSTEPAGDERQLDRSSALLLFAAEVDRHEFWITGASPAAVIASVRAHLPAGAARSGWGGSEASAFASFTIPTSTRASIGPATLAVEAVQLADRDTGVRVDAGVRYRAPRLPAQRIPGPARVLDVTVADYHSPPTLSLTVTKLSAVRRIAAIVNHLPFIAALRGVAFSCPILLPAPIDTFTFRSAPGGDVVATVSEPANTPTTAEACFTATLTIGSHHEPGLLQGGILLREAGAILGAKLVSG